MFKCGLLATTAFVVTSSLSLLATPSWALARSPTAEPGRDKNDEFMCTYGNGQFSVREDVGASNSASYSEWQHVAVPISGQGQTVRRIVVKEGKDPSGKRTFSAGIYSNTPSGPGNLIAGGKGKASKNCGEVTLSITPTTLKRNTTYWVEEIVPFPKGTVHWKEYPRANGKAYEQFHYYLNSSSRHISYTTPWTQQTTGPWFRLK